MCGLISFSLLAIASHLFIYCFPYGLACSMLINTAYCQPISMLCMRESVHTQTALVPSTVVISIYRSSLSYRGAVISLEEKNPPLGSPSDLTRFRPVSLPLVRLDVALRRCHSVVT